LVTAINETSAGSRARQARGGGDLIEDALAAIGGTAHEERL
jgi:hypothetical protein